jgi:hypothetical protein
MYALGYAVWILAFRLVTLTIATFVLSPQNARLQDISEFYTSNEILVAGIGAALFVVFLNLLHPLTSVSTPQILSWDRTTKRFAPGLLQGSLLAAGLAVAFLLSGLYEDLGVFIQAEDTSLAIGTVALRIVALLLLVYCEEFIFRQKILAHLRRRLPELWSVGITAVIYCATKGLQFDLGLRQSFTLFLVSFILGLRAIIQGDFGRGAGFWAGLLIVLHPLLSLPILGNDFHGVLMLQYQPAAGIDSATAAAISGGVSGPLASLALQLLFLFDIARSILKNRSLLLPK